MKKILFALASIATLSATAQTTVKKVFIEDYTGTWCGWCPEGTVLLEGLEDQYPATVIPIANHNGDQLQTTDGATIDNDLGVNSYPNGSIDRFQFSGETKISVSRGKWASYVSSRLGTAAIASVSFTNMSKTGNTYKGRVNVKFVSAPKAGVPLSLNIYVLEDSIAATGSYAQSNYSSAVQGGASPLANWFHNNTLRQALGGAWGWAAFPPSPMVGTTYTKDFTFTPDASWKPKQLHLAAFVAYNGTVAANQKEILNTEEIALKNVNPLAVHETSSITVNNVFPNPASINDVVKVEYNLLQSGTVDLRVMNMLGQVVAHPYHSYEVSGTHTAPFRASDLGLAAGNYMVEISTEAGRKVMPLTLK
ncbi:MAG: Omp28-related outer membrane protein [Bacteroidetes bacterium]|nr:Omp28-related outer membrane protein [Bacteroidota bacterium]